MDMIYLKYFTDYHCSINMMPFPCIVSYPFSDRVSQKHGPDKRVSTSYFLLLKNVVGTHYAHNFEEVGGAYCFWDVCACVRASFHASIRAFVHASVHPLRFLMYSITSESCMLGLCPSITGHF